MNPISRVARRLGLEPVFEAIASGGIEVVTPETDNELQEVWFRTLVELDGDVVTSVLSSRLEDRSSLQAHFDRVEREVEAIVAALRRTRIALASAIGGAATAIAGLAAVIDSAVSLLDGVAMFGWGIASALIIFRVPRARSTLMRWLVSGVARRASIEAFGRLPLQAFQQGALAQRTRIF